MGERKYKMSKHMGIFTKNTKSGIRYQVKWRRPDGTQTSKTFRTIREAKEHKGIVEREKSRGNLPDDRRAKVKFGDFAQEVFSTLGHGPSTILRREGIMKKHISPLFGDLALSQIHRTHISQAIKKWTDDGLAPRSIFNHLNVIRPVFAEAMLQNIISRNPMEGIKSPKAKEVRRTPLTPEQCKALLDAIDPRYEYAIHFALATGVRWSEFANMKIRDFKPLVNSVMVTGSKTSAGIRELPLDREDTLRVSMHIGDTGRNGADADSPLFTSPEGKALHHSNFRRRVFLPACSKAGLEGITFHDLRRTHATMLVAEGHDAKVVQERMGHISISTTLKFYAKATVQGKMKAAGAKERYLKPEEEDRMKEAE
jgi:integrase